MEDPDIIFSALKKEERGGGLLLRCYNPGPGPRTAALATPWQPDGQCRLDEAPTGEAWGPAAVGFAPNQTRTLRLRRP